MSKILPKNTAKEKDITPKVFFIWGQSMSGKTYLARQFPDPIILNTDGNAKKVTTPSVEVFDFVTFMQAIKELEEGKHTFKTIIVDLVDDIKTMLEMHVLEKYNAENLADIPWGKGYNEVKGTWQRLMVRLSQMPYNIIYISHIATATDDRDNEKVIEVPSLEQKYYNMTMGRSDMSIKCRKIGNNYSQLIVSKRDNYKPEDFNDEAVLDVIKDAIGLFPRSTDMKPTGGTKAVKKVLKGTLEPELKLEPKIVDVDPVVTEMEEPTEKEPSERVKKAIKKVVEAKSEYVEEETDKETLEEKALKVAKKTPAKKKEVAKDSGSVTGYYFDPHTAKYVTLSGDEKPTPELIPIPKAIYDTAMAEQPEAEVIEPEIEVVEQEVVSTRPKVAPKKLKPMGGKVV